jgi:hypothetical protein
MQLAQPCGAVQRVRENAAISLSTLLRSVE